MNKLKEIAATIATIVAGIAAFLFFSKSKGDAKARKAEGKAEAYEEQAELDKLLAIEEIAKHNEERQKGQEIADSIDPLKEDTTKPNHTRKRFSFK